MKSFPTILVFCLLLTACNLPGRTAQPGSDPSQLGTDIAATLEVLLEPALSQQPLSTPTLESLPSPTLEVQAPPTSAPFPTPDVTLTPEPGFGSISGGILNYPYGALPKITVVAFEQTPPYHYWYWITAAGNTSYSMDGYVSTGKYQVVAYDPSGHKGGCTTLVQVKNNEMVICNITDWAGSYPDKPAGVP